MAERLTAGREVKGVLACKREPDLEAIKRNFVVLTGAQERVERVIDLWITKTAA